MRIGQIVDKILAIVLIILILAFAAYAQAPPPSSNPPGAPIDSIAVILLALGATYGIKHARNRSDTE